MAPQGSAPGLTVCCHCLEFHNNFEQGTFSFCTGLSAKYVADLGWLLKETHD